MVNKLSLTVVLGAFNAKSRLSYNNNISSYEISKVDDATSQFRFQQVIKEPVHIIGDSSSSIDLIFTTLNHI